MEPLVAKCDKSGIPCQRVCNCCKQDKALYLIRATPCPWFRPNGVDERDMALLSAPEVAFVDYGQGSYLRKLVCGINLSADTH
jgi:hypothetical protein